ncbi:hypothetical protein R3W88_033547 [Solanum pinnatisectum]|uniref:Uncharacterized protein n=1 Tax=Solanum pinnatisectum TaxID=50273 RepID=A0AAV9K0R0_9SOLN|nr:hypothetical protein R3W88_033547 [Solanum pinnatisectum]
METMKKMSMIKRRWNAKEDELLQKLVEEHGAENWSYWFWWCNQLNPQVEHQSFTLEEDNTIINAHAKFGNCWSKIASLLPRRIDNAINNHWYSTLKCKHPSMSEDFTFENPQPPLKKSFSIGPGGNLGFNRFPQLCLYPNIALPGGSLPLSTFSPIMLDPLISLSPHGSDLRNLDLSRFPQLSLYPPVTPIGEICPFLSFSPVIPEKSKSLSPCGSNMSNLVAPIMPDPSTHLSLSLCEFRSTKELNLVNRIEQIDQLEFVSTCEPTPSNFMPQISITQSGMLVTSTEKQLLSPKFLMVLQDMIRKRSYNFYVKA